MESSRCTGPCLGRVLVGHLCITTTFPYLRLSKAFDKRKDRYTLLSPRLVEELNIYYRMFCPREWIFFGRNLDEPMALDTAQKIFYGARDRAGLPDKGGVHSLRHSFATHLLESGVEITVVQRLLGHSSLSTTSVYLHVRQKRLAQIQSPLQLLQVAQSSQFSQV